MLSGEGRDLHQSQFFLGGGIVSPIPSIPGWGRRVGSSILPALAPPSHPNVYKYSSAPQLSMGVGGGEKEREKKEQKDATKTPNAA